MVDVMGIIENGYSNVVDDISSFVSNVSPSQIAVGSAIGGAAVAAGIVAIASGSKSTSTKRKKKTKRGIKRDRRFKSKQKHEQRYKRKRKYKVYGKKGRISPKKKRKVKHKKSYSRRKGVHYTKNGQPYILLRSGKARFIKKRKR